MNPYTVTVPINPQITHYILPPPAPSHTKKEEKLPVLPSTKQAMQFGLVSKHEVISGT